MRIFYLSVFFLLTLFSVRSQTFTGTGGPIPGTGFSPTCFNATVSGVGTINASKGLAQVCLSITHTSVDELEILLQAPDGTYVPLSIQNGAAGADNYTNTCFSATASTPIKFSTAPSFTGTFLPEGHLGAVNNGQNADNTWKLCVLDRRNSGNSGNLISWSLTFSTSPAPPAPALPNCTSTIPTASDCLNATSVCDFNGACGKTTNSGIKTWPALTNNCCFGIDNNSFVKFIASSSTVSFSVWVTSSTVGFNDRASGLQMLFFSGNCNGSTINTYGCYNRIYPVSPGGKPIISLIYAQGLTPGNTYYLMIDGAGNGDNCEYRIAANSGVNALNITSNTPSNNICLGETVTLSATGGNGSYKWYLGTQLLSSVSTLTISPSAIGSYTYRVETTIGLGCPTFKDFTLNVNDLPAKPVINSTAASCVAAGKSTISNYVNTLTYNFNPTGPTVASNGAINGMTTGTNYTVTASNGNCTSQASVQFSNAAQLTSIPAPSITTTNASCSAAGTSTINNFSNTLTYTFNPSGPTIGTNGIINGMITGTSYTVSASDGTCNSPVSNSFSNAAPTGIPSYVFSIIDPTCTNATGGIVIQEPVGNNYEYNLNGGAYQSNPVFSNLPTGSYTTTVKDKTTVCVSPSSPFTIKPGPVLPAVPGISSTAATCLTAGTSTVSNYTNTITYTFSPSGPSLGAGGTISGMVTGTNYTVTASNGSCNSSPSNTFSNAAQFTAPSAPVFSTITQPTCTTPTGIITITQVAGVTYSINGNNYQTSNVFSGLTSGNYSLTAKNAAGCISTAIAAVINNQPDCNTQDLFVPNAFTPNGDGKNDILFVKGTTIKSMQLLIFNQWGEKIFESVKQEQGWDGSVGGKAQPVGVYVYILKVGHNNGKTQQLKGSITLIR